MASQVSPGVIIKERDLSNAVVVGTSALRGAIASTFSKGPVGSIVNISSERELIDKNDKLKWEEIKCSPSLTNFERFIESISIEVKFTMPWTKG